MLAGFIPTDGVCTWRPLQAPAHLAFFLLPHTASAVPVPGARDLYLKDEPVWNDHHITGLEGDGDPRVISLATQT